MYCCFYCCLLLKINYFSKNRDTSHPITANRRIKELSYALFNLSVYSYVNFQRVNYYLFIYNLIGYIQCDALCSVYKILNAYTLYVHATHLCLWFPCWPVFVLHYSIGYASDISSSWRYNFQVYSTFLSRLGLLCFEIAMHLITWFLKLIR